MNDRTFGIAGPGASRYPIELEAPDIGPYRAGNCGIEYVSTFDSGKTGPHLMLAALTHGNELSYVRIVEQQGQAKSSYALGSELAF